MSSEPVTFNPNAWTGMGELGWPNPKVYSLPLPLEARPSWRKALAVSAGLLLAAALFGLLGMYDHRGPVTGVMCATSFAAFGVVTLRRAWKLLHSQDSCPAVEMHPHGLIIPDLFERTVPWSEVTHVDYDPPIIWITVRDGARFNPPSGEDGLNGSAQPIPMGLPVGLDVSTAKLFEAIQAHRAHFGNGGQSE